MKKHLSILLVIATLLACVPASPLLHTHAEAAWDGTPATAFASGDGTEASPYLIGTVDELVYLAISVNQGNSYEGQYIALANDIEFSPSDFAEGGSLYNDGNGWTPIGNAYTTPFAGCFDGNGYAIYNLAVTMTKEAESRNFAGLFGYSTGTIRNVDLIGGKIDVTVNVSTATQAVRYIYAGSIVGCAVAFTDIAGSGVTTGCTSDCSVHVEVIANQAAVSSVYAYAGGIAGYASGGSTSNNHNTGSVSVTLDPSMSTHGYAYAGGIAGYNQSHIDSCSNIGQILAVTTRTASPNNPAETYAGGLVGFSNGNGYASYGYITNSQNTGTVRANGIDRSATTGSESNKTSAYAGGISGSSDLAVFENCKNFGAVHATADALGEGSHRMSVQAKAAGITADSTGTILNCYNSAPITSEAVTSTARKLSSSCFSEAGGICAYSNSDGSVAKCMNAGQVIATVNATNATLESSAYAGGICGTSRGTLTECANSASVYAEGTTNISNTAHCGGITARLGGTLSKCSNTGNISAHTSSHVARAAGIAAIRYNSMAFTIEDCYNTGHISSSAEATTYSGTTSYGTSSGGIASDLFADNTIWRCYNTGLIEATVASSDYAAHAYAGAIAGSTSGASIYSCYHLDNMTWGVGNPNSRVTVCTDAQMQLQETFSAFDFENAWTMEGDPDYPYPELSGTSDLFATEIVAVELIQEPYKTTYIAGDYFSLEGVILQGTQMDGTSVPISDYQCSISQTAPLTAGTHTVELRYNALRVSFEIVVNPKAFDTIEVTDLLIPVFGTTPDTSVTVDNFYHTVSSLDWSTDVPFTFGKEYTLTLTLAPTGNAVYSADTVVLVNGAQAQCQYDAETGAILATVQFPAIRGVYFHVMDAETGNPIPGATITLGQNELTTVSSGTAFFEIAPGSVTNLSVKADPYKDYIVDNFVIGEDPNVYILMNTIDDSIQAAFCNGTDVLLNSCQINTYAPQLKAQIQVSGRSARKIVRYEIVQKNLLLRPTVIATSTSGTFTIPNTSFKKNADVYVRMYTEGSDGTHVYECPLKIKTLAFKMESELDFDKLLPFASETGMAFPSGTPILDGTKFSLPGAFGKNTKPTVQLGNDKIVIGLGTVQDLMKKDQTKKDSDEIFQEMLDDWKEQDTYDKESKVTGMLALVIEFDEDGVTRTYGQCYVEYKLEIETGATIWLWAIPIRVDIEVGFGGKLIVTNLGFDFENSEFLIPTVQLGLDGSVEARLGIGCKVISAGIYGSAELEVIMDLLPEVALSSLELSGELGLHATYNGVFVTKSLKYPLLSAEFSWPDSTYALRRSLFTAESYELRDRSYLDERSQWLGEIAKLSENSTVSALQTSAYEGIAPQMAVCGDTVMMVFTDDDGSEGLNYQHLYYSLYDRASRTWSTPAKVDDNGLTDLQFEVISDGSHIHIIYTEAGQITEENQDDNEALAATVEVATAVYDPAADRFTDYTVLTDNDYFETMPQLAATDDGLVAVWATNLANDVFCQNANNLIYRSVYSGGSWSAPKTCGPMGATVASLDAGRLDGETYIAAIRDTDCDLATVHDRFISLTAPDGTVTQVQTDTGTNDNATFLTIGGTDRLVWYADSNLHSITEPGGIPEALLDQAVPTLSPDFQFITLGTGSAILYTCTTVTTDDDGNKVTGSDVFGLFYRDGQWGEPVAVTHTQADRYVDAFAVFADGEDLVVPYRSTAATFINGELELACDFMTTNVPFAHNIAIDALSFPPSQLFQGDALDVTVRVANHAWKDVDAVTVAVTDDSGNVVFTQTADCRIGSGGTENLIFSLDKSLLQLGSGYTVSISPTGYADADASDNTAVLALWYSDLSVQAKQQLLPDGNYLQYTVTNQGNLPGSGELQVYCMDGDTKTQITIVPLDTLEPGQNVSGLLPVKDSYYDAGTVFVSVLPDTEELYDFNDTVTVPVQELSFSSTDIVDQEDTAAVGPALTGAYFLYDLYTNTELSVTAEENGFAFTGIEGVDPEAYTYADATLTLHESYLQTLAVGYHHLTLHFASGDHTEDLLLTLEVTDSTPVPVTVTAQQNGTVYYDTHPVEPGVDFTYTTASEGSISYAYSADGTVWHDGLPTAAGAYTVRLTIAPDTVHHFAGTQCTFPLTIEKAARAISSPLPLANQDGRQTFGNSVPTAGADQGQILYGYSLTNDPATVANWSSEGILPAESNLANYYIFAKITEGADYLEAVSLGMSAQAHVHSYQETTHAPSCEEAGATEFVCSCGDRYDGEVLPATGHTPVTDPAEAPNCTESGLTEGSHCSICGKVLTAQQTIPATGHELADQWLYDSEGHYHKCTVCNGFGQQNSHSFDNACDAACDVCGYTRSVAHIPDGTWVTNGDRHWQTCTVCGAKTQISDHRYDDACDGECNDCGQTHYVIHDYLPNWFLDETYHWRECANCQHKAMYVKHDYDNNCDTDCNTCGHTRTTIHYYTNGISMDDTQHWRTCLYCHERILVEDHRYDNACDTSCDDCGYDRTVTHQYSSIWTGDETGHWYECLICQHKKDLLDHSYDNLCDTDCNDCSYVRTVSHYYRVIWSADDAEHWYECDVCGDRTQVSGHSWKEATCYEPKTCTVCGMSVGTAKGHSWQAATCTEPKTCTVCGETEGTENWHSWKDGSCTEPMICTVCGEVGSPALGHNWTAATCWVPKTCSVCGISEGEPIAHSWTTATCTEHSKCAHCGLFGSDALNHDWCDATCTEPMICNRCGETAGRELGHNMLPADCTMPKTCARCGHTAGSPLGHSWFGPTCTKSKTCNTCGLTQGAALGHHWKPATCTEPETCTDCGATQENPTGHNWQPATCYKPETCLNCGETNGRPRGHSWTASTCTKPQTCVDCGLTTGKPAPHIYSDGLDGTCNVCGIHRENVETRKVVHMFRMYNPNTGEHFYTGSTVERDNLIAVGWQYEGVGFTFPANTGLPVHRLFQPSTGEHLYTMDEAEKDRLMADGWNYEGIAFNSAYDTEAVQHRLHNPNARVGAYHFTFSLEERDFLISLGWEYQGIGWYSCWK